MSVKPLGATGVMSKTQTEGSLSIDFHISNAKSLELSKELTSWIKGC